MKRKKKQLADFPKKKQKLGKGKRPPENATKVSFKSQSISVPGQLETAKGPTTHRKLGLQELLKQLSHSKPSVCRDALNGLRELFLNSSSPLLSENLSLVINGLVSSLFSYSQSVHHALYLLLKHIYSTVPSQVISPYFERILAGLRCAITHLNQTIRLSGLKIMDLMFTHYSFLLQPHINQLLPYYLPLVSRGCSSKNSITTGYSGGGAKMGLRSSRLLVLKQILNLVTLVSSSPSVAHKPHPPIINIEKECVSLTSCKSVPIDIYKYLYCSSLSLKLSSPNIMSSYSTCNNTTRDTCSVSFIDQLFHSLLEYWIELSPLVSVEPSHGKRKLKIVEELIELNDVLLQLLCLLVEVKGHVTDNDRNHIITHFLPHFPFPTHYGSVNVRLAYLLILTGYNSLDSVYEYLSEKINTYSQVTQCVNILTKILTCLINRNGKGLELFYDSVVKLFVNVNVTSLAKQHVLLFIKQLLDNHIKLNVKFSAIFRDSFLYPFLSFLPTMLLKQPIKVDFLSHVLDILKCSLSMKMKTVEQSFVTNFYQIYGPNGFVYLAPHSLLSPTVCLISHLSSLNATNLPLLSSLVMSDQLPTPVIISLIYMIHNKLLDLNCDDSNSTLLAHHISFLLSLLIGYPEKDLRQVTPSVYLIQREHFKVVEPLGSYLANGREEVAEVIISCLLNCPLSEQQLLHVLEPSLIQLLRSLTVFPIDMIYRLVCLLSHCSINVSSTLSQEVSPLLLTCLCDVNHSEHVLVKKCSSLIRKNILISQTTLKSSLLELMKHNILNST